MQTQNIYAISLDQAADLIAAVGSQRTVFMRGHTGNGKTWTAAKLPERAGFEHYKSMVVDCANLDGGDVMVPMPNRERGCTEMLPNELFAPAMESPHIIVLDELEKAPRIVIKALLPLIYDRRVGTRNLHPDTIVVATGNLESEGLGAAMEAHETNRMVEVEIRKWGNMEWLAWGINHNVHPAILGWVRDDAPPTDDEASRGQLFADFREVNANDNHYIHHPQAIGRSAFVTPRSLHAASEILHSGLGRLDNHTLTAALIGTIGDYGAKDLMAFVELASELPTLEAIRKKPNDAKVPTNAAATCMVVYKALANIDATWIDAWMEYMERLDPSAQGLFANGVRSERFNRKSEIMNTKCFGSWCVKNQHMFTADKV